MQKHEKIAGKRTRRNIIFGLLMTIVLLMSYLEFVAIKNYYLINKILFVFIILAMVYHLSDWRCSKCDSYLGRDNPKYCSKCGCKIQ